MPVEGQSYYKKHRDSYEAYRKKVKRFTLQFSLKDTEAQEWFYQQKDPGLYLKMLILEDKERQTKRDQEIEATQEVVEKRMAENYEITQAVRIGGKEVVFGVDETNAEPYFCAFYTANELFYEYSDCMVGDNFAEMMKLFGERIQQQAGKVLAEQEQASVPLAPLTPGDCFPNSYDECIEGKIVAVKTSALAPEYRTANHQLVYVTGGNGAQANARGNACFCINLYSGRHIRWERYDIQGEIKPEKLPGWAKERLSGILQQEQAKKEQRRNDKEAR